MGCRENNLQLNTYALPLRKKEVTKMFEIEELSPDDLSHITAILEAEALGSEDLIDAEGEELETKDKRFRWYKDEEEAEQEARDYLTDGGYLWREQVAAGSTTAGLEEWAEQLIGKYGWSGIIATHDGCERVAELGDGTWFPYIRVN